MGPFKQKVGITPKRVPKFRRSNFYISLTFFYRSLTDAGIETFSLRPIAVAVAEILTTSLSNRP